MSFWNKTFARPAVRAVFSFSLALALVVSGLAQLEPAGPQTERGNGAGPNFSERGRYTRDELRQSKATDERGEAIARAKPDPRLSSRAKEIKRSPLYRDAGVKQESNWIARGFSRLGDWVRRLMDRSGPRFDPPSNVPNISGRWIIVAAWVLLGIGVSVLLYFVLRRFSFSLGLRKRVRAMLNEEEPERSADEWLARADELERDGLFREAIRCLYLASLVRIDEAGVARFIRSETNWEHLTRIEASPRLPTHLAFREPTQSFDRIWYGNQKCDSIDVREFRHTYETVCESLSRPNAA